MGVGEVVVGVDQIGVGVLVTVRSPRCTFVVVIMLVMFVVAVPVAMDDRLVPVRMVVSLGQVEPHPDTHQC